MKYLILLSIILLSVFIGGCASSPTMPPVEATNIDLEVVFMEPWEITHLYNKKQRADGIGEEHYYVTNKDGGQDRKRYRQEGFAEWKDVDGRRECTIYVSKPTDQGDYKADLVIAAELKHCVYGSYHY